MKALIMFFLLIEAPAFIELGGEIERNQYQIILFSLKNNGSLNRAVDTIFIDLRLVYRTSDGTPLISQGAIKAYFSEEQKLSSHHQTKYLSKKLWLFKDIAVFQDKIVYNKEAKKLGVIESKLLSRKKFAIESFLLIIFTIFITLLFFCPGILVGNEHKTVLIFTLFVLFFSFFHLPFLFFMFLGGISFFIFTLVTFFKKKA